MKGYQLKEVINCRVETELPITLEFTHYLDDVEVIYDLDNHLRVSRNYEIISTMHLTGSLKEGQRTLATFELVEQFHNISSNRQRSFKGSVLNLRQVDATEDEFEELLQYMTIDIRFGED